MYKSSVYRSIEFFVTSWFSHYMCFFWITILILALFLAGTVGIFFLRHLLANSFYQSSSVSLENNIRIVRGLWGDQQVSIQNNTSIFCFSGNVLCANLLYCWYNPCSHHPLHPAYQWPSVDLKKHYQVMVPPYLPLEWRKIIIRVILLIFYLDFLGFFSAATVRFFFLRHILAKSFHKSPPLSIESNIRVLGSLWSAQRVSI